MHNLGSTGVKVSQLCLGAMMFGAVGQPRPRRLRPHHPHRARRRHQLHRHRRRLLAGRVRGDRRQGARRAPRRRRARDQVPRRRWATTRTMRGNSRRWIMREVENSLRRLGTDYIDLYQVHRPDPATDVDETLGALERPRAPGQGPLRRLVDVPGRATSSRRSGSPSGAAASGSCASSRRTRSSCAASRPTVLPTCQRYGMGVIPWSPLAGGWLAGAVPQGRRATAPTPRMARRRSLEYDLPRAGEPAQARRRRGAGEAGRRRGHHADAPRASRSCSSTRR